MLKAGSVGSRATGYSYWDDEGVFEEDVDDFEWDDRGRNIISHIYVSFDKMIRTIQFGYLENGVLVLSKKYGSDYLHQPEGLNFRVVKLKQDEYVTALSGVVLPGKGIKELTFRTNRGSYGPFGLKTSGTKTVIEPAISDQREFGGFFGSYSYKGLTSIGMYVNPITSSESTDV